jgi:mannose-6-phosphate isomerase-like protein (cupin superfamily)
MRLEIPPDAARTDVFGHVLTQLTAIQLVPESMDLARPWGGFFVIGEEKAEHFTRVFFPERSFQQLSLSGRLSPKILMVEPGRKLSWQYHHRRAEIWKSVHGEVGLITSATDAQGPLELLREQQAIELPTGHRHRLVGLGHWGVVAEIWVHTNPARPSDEEDIVRIEDEFGR